MIYRTLNWTGGFVIKCPQVGGLGIHNHLDEVTALFDVNAVSFYTVAKHFANLEATHYDVKCNTFRVIV